MLTLLVVEKTSLWHALTIGITSVEACIFSWVLGTERCLVAKGECTRLSSLFHTLLCMRTLPV